MCIFLYTLLFSLALGPSVQRLQAQEMVTDISLTSLAKGETASPQFTSDGSDAFTDKDSVIKDTTLGDTNDQSSSTNPTIMKTTETPTSMVEDLTSSESHTVPSEDATTTSDLKASTTQGSITTSTTSATITTTFTTVDTEPTSKQDESTAVFSSSESTVLTEEKTTKLMQTISTTLAPTTESISTPPFFPNQPEISTQIPASSTHPSSVTTTTQKQLSTSTPETQDDTTDSTMSPTFNETVLEVESDKSEKSFNWKIVVIIGLVGCCVLMILCIGLAMKHKKNSGKQSFGQMNGRPKKKKGVEDDVWAGPVNLGGVEKEDGNGPEEALVQGEDKPDGPEVMLSTFTMPDEKAAVGRPGSQEVKRWEEQERLLYIDEDAKGEEKEKDQNTEAKQNGGEAYCLTTAV